MTARFLLPLASLHAAAEVARVRLPQSLGTGLDPADREAAQQGLVDAGAASPQGVLDLVLATAFAGLSAPVVTVEITALPTPASARPPLGWQATYVLGDASLLGVVRRADDPRVEVVAADPEDLRAELLRLVAALPGRAADLEAAVVPLSALTGSPERDATGLAAVLRGPALDAAARIVESARQSLRAVVVGRGGAAGVPTGSLLWYALPDGWVSVEPAAAEGIERPVRIAPTRADALPAALAPLVAGALGTPANAGLSA